LTIHDNVGVLGPPRLGLDVFSLRSQGLSAIQILEFCAARGVGVVHFSEPRLLGATEPGALRDVRASAEGLGIALEVGMLSICPGATIFNAAAGPAEAQLSQAIDLAVALGSPLVRCVVGSFRDRVREGGIERRIEETLAVIGAVRSRAGDAGVKLAVENHAGDMQARELKMLVEQAGSDLVGVCLDAGNAFWAMEDPRVALETLAPYVLTSHTRDTAVRPTPDGAEVAWTRMGDGNIGIDQYLDRLHALRPDLPVMLEIIVMPAPRLLPYRDERFRAGYPQMTESEFDQLVTLVETARPAPLPSGAVDAAAELANVEASIQWAATHLQR
jgi:sugar phosphate isomerase/epimerase